jgi:hypothetical protein
MGKWQNKNETYATNEFSEIYDNNNNLIGTLTGNVRHHRFPSLRFLRDNVSQGTFLGFQDDIVLGVRLKNIHFPPELENEIVSYGISYAKRDVNNMTVYGQDLLLHSLELFDHTTLTGTAQTVYDPSVATKAGIAAKHTTAGANINRTLSFRGAGGSRIFYKVNQEIGRGHNPDIQLDKPSIQPDYIANEIFLKLEYENEGFKHHTELENHDSEDTIDNNQTAAETVLRKKFSLINNTNKIIEVFNVNCKTFEREDGSTFNREIVESSEVVHIMPFDKDNNIYAINEFRGTIEDYVIGFPAGKIDDGEVIEI